MADTAPQPPPCTTCNGEKKDDPPPDPSRGSGTRFVGLSAGVTYQNGTYVQGSGLAMDTQGNLYGTSTTGYGTPGNGFSADVHGVVATDGNGMTDVVGGKSTGFSTGGVYDGTVGVSGSMNDSGGTLGLTVAKPGAGITSTTTTMTPLGNPVTATTNAVGNAYDGAANAVADARDSAVNSAMNYATDKVSNAASGVADSIYQSFQDTFLPQF